MMGDDGKRKGAGRCGGKEELGWSVVCAGD